MPGATPIYGFPYPDPSDLVANYPALGQDLAEEIETVIDALPTSSGLTFITSSTFATAATVSVNNCFTATYNSYFIVLDLSANSNASQGNLRLRVSGTDSTTSYTGGVMLVNYSSGSVSGSSGGTTSFPLGYLDTNGSPQTFTLMAPKLTRRTRFFGAASNLDEDGGMSTGNHTAATAYDGFTVYAATGTITGNLQVFGYQLT